MGIKARVRQEEEPQGQRVCGRNACRVWKNEKASVAGTERGGGGQR